MLQGTARACRRGAAQPWEAPQRCTALWRPPLDSSHALKARLSPRRRGRLSAPWSWHGAPPPADASSAPASRAARPAAGTARPATLQGCAGGSKGLLFSTRLCGSRRHARCKQRGSCCKQGRRHSPSSPGWSGLKCRLPHRRCHPCQACHQAAQRLQRQATGPEASQIEAARTLTEAAHDAAHNGANRRRAAGGGLHWRLCRWRRRRGGHHAGRCWRGRRARRSRWGCRRRRRRLNALPPHVLRGQLWEAAVLAGARQGKAVDPAVGGASAGKAALAHLNLRPAGSAAAVGRGRQGRGGAGHAAGRLVEAEAVCCTSGGGGWRGRGFVGFVGCTHTPPKVQRELAQAGWRWARARREKQEQRNVLAREMRTVECPALAQRSAPRKAGGLASAAERVGGTTLLTAAVAGDAAGKLRRALLRVGGRQRRPGAPARGVRQRGHPLLVH